MVKKEVAGKKSLKNNYSKINKNFQINKILLENFVSLQKVMTNLASKFDDLSNQISRLLELFEISAKTLAKRDYAKKEDNKELVEKLDSLLDQNKVIAKGIALMHEKEMPEEIPLMPKQSPQQPIRAAPLPRQQMPLKPNIPAMSSQPMPGIKKEGYAKPSQEFFKSRLIKE